MTDEEINASNLSLTEKAALLALRAAAGGGSFVALSDTPDMLNPNKLLVGDPAGDAIAMCDYPLAAVQHNITSPSTLSAEIIAGAAQVFVFMLGAWGTPRTLPTVQSMLSAWPDLAVAQPANGAPPGWLLHIFCTNAVVIQSSADFFLDATIPAPTGRASYSVRSFLLSYDATDTGSGPRGSINGIELPRQQDISDFVAGTPSEGNVVKWVSGVPTWAVP
jgi:hypothetical protein